ncbi:MAG: Lrp/AsnC family transcriptional regulator [Nanoarchaeota archaeon]
MARKLDLIDRKILLELDTNARASFAEVAKATGIGKNNVQYRVKRLIEDGVIKKFVTQFSLGTLGLFLGKIYMQLAGLDSGKEKELYAYLLNNKRISWVAQCEGSYDLMIGSYVENIRQFNEVKTEFFQKFEKYITAYDIVFLVEGYTSQRTYLLEKKAVPEKIGKFIGKEKIALDEQDKKILRLIANNARFTYLDIAKEMDINIKTAIKRIKELEEKGVIQGYVTFLNPKVIGYNFFKLFISLQNYQSAFQSFITYCKELPNVVHTIEALGPWEVEIELETASLDELYTISHHLRNAFPTIIKRVESIIISSELKLDFFPEWY